MLQDVNMDAACDHRLSRGRGKFLGCLGIQRRAVHRSPRDERFGHAWVGADQRTGVGYLVGV